MATQFLCPEDKLERAVAIIRRDDLEGLREVAVLCGLYPQDPRLPFLQGSLLAGLRRYEEARAAMTEAVRLEPHYAIARFQLGFLELTSGEAAAAEATWAPLKSLPPDDPLRLFSKGLQCMIRDDFVACSALLREGIEKNSVNQALNKDMQLILDTLASGAAPPSGDDNDVSPTHLLLQHYTNTTKH